MIEFFEIPLLEDLSAVEKFPDVADAVWYTPYIYTARDLGIVQGYYDGEFKPEQTVSRAEMLKIFIETSGITYTDVPSESSSFTDVVVTEDGPWYIQYANFAFIHGLVDRVPMLYPDSPMQRLDAIKLLYRAEEQFGETEGWRTAVSSESETELDASADADHSE